MLKWGIAAFGVLLILCGLGLGITGYGIVEIERGWSSVIAGAVLFAGGAIVLSVAALMHRIDILIAAAPAPARAADKAAPAEVAPPAPNVSSSQAKRPDLPAPPPPPPSEPVAPPAPAPVVEAITEPIVAKTPLPQKAPPPPPYPSGKPAIGAVLGASAAAGMAALAAKISRTEIPAPPSPPPSPPPDLPTPPSPDEVGRDSHRRMPPSLKVVVDVGKAPIAEAAAPDTAPPATVFAETYVAEAELIASAPAEKAPRKSFLPVPPLATAPAQVDWPASPTADAEPSPGPAWPADASELAADTATAGVVEETRAEATIIEETTAQKPAVEEVVAEKAIAVTSSLAEDRAEPAPATEQRPWVDKLFAELDELGAPDPGASIPPPPPIPAPRAPAVEPDRPALPEDLSPPQDDAARSPPHHAIPWPGGVELQDDAAGPAVVAAPRAEAPAVETRPVETHPVEMHPVETQPVEMSAAPPRNLVRSYEAQGVNYSLYDDGSIDAETTGGTFHFASLDELRAFIEKRGGG